MDKDNVFEYLMDIKDSNSRLKQVEYLLQSLKITDSYASPTFDREGTSTEVSDPTARAVMGGMTKIEDLTDERDLLTKKLALYSEWIGYLDEELLELVEYIFIRRCSPLRYHTEINPMSDRTYRRYRAALVDTLMEHPIAVECEYRKR